MKILQIMCKCYTFCHAWWIDRQKDKHDRWRRVYMFIIRIKNTLTQTWSAHNSYPVVSNTDQQLKKIHQKKLLNFIDKYASKTVTSTYTSKILNTDTISHEGLQACMLDTVVLELNIATHVCENTHTHTHTHTHKHTHTHTLNTHTHTIC